MKPILYLLLLACVSVQAQVNFSSRPIRLQIYPRNASTNLGTVSMAGVVTAGGHDVLRFEKYRNSSIQQTIDIPLTGAAGQAFSTSTTIVSELASYQITASIRQSGGGWTQLFSADSIAAGDAIIIQGQSNAEAAERLGSSSAYINKFVRVYTGGTEFWTPDPPAWFIGQGDSYNTVNGNTGQWGLVLGNDVITHTQRPVVIFNGAHGNKPISFFLRNDAQHNDPNTNYGRLLQRLRETGFDQTVRAIFWYQGEANANTSLEVESTESYKLKFYQLKTAWKQDLPMLSNFYLNQIRYGCAQNDLATFHIKEALRQIGVESPDTRVYAGGALFQSDGCHFSFANGYEKLGHDWALMLNYDLYGAPAQANMEPPVIASVTRPFANQVYINLKPSANTISIQPGALGNFRFEGPVAQPAFNSAEIVGNTIILNLSNYPPAATGISYQERNINSNSPNIVNGRNMPLVDFYNVAVLQALPKYILSLSGRRVAERNVVLQWQSANEQTIASFEVEKSKDGIVFAAVERVNSRRAAGGSFYQLTDKDAEAARLYYRIKIVGIDGATNYSSLVSISAGAVREPLLEVWPNPSKAATAVRLSALQSANVRFTVVDINGRTVAHWRADVVAGENLISIPDGVKISNGVYSLRADLNGRIMHARFIIIR